MTDTELSVALRDLAEAPAPPMRLDLDRARQRGKRRRTLRRTPAIAGVAAVAVAAGVTVPQLIDSGAGPARPAAQGAASQEKSSPDGEEAPPAPVNTEHNPMVSYAEFGWLPEQLKGVGYAIGSYDTLTEARGTGELAPQVWVTVLDNEPPLNMGNQLRDPVKVPANVGGGKAYWVTENPEDPYNGGNSYLHWQTPDGRWAKLNAMYLVGDDLRGIVERIAENVRFETSLVPLPLRIRELPDNFQFRDASLKPFPYASAPPPHDGKERFHVQLVYFVDGVHVTIDVFDGKRFADGGPKAGTAACKVAKGLTACVDATGSSDAPIEEIGGKQGLLDRITLLGTDKHDWTTEVIG